MTDHHALYLFKAARRPYYRKENLHLLAAERGSVVEVAYNRMWVAPEYIDEGSIPRGTPVYFVFTERPYSLFVPVRQGQVVGVQQDELMLRLRVLLHSWIGVEDRDLVDFTRLVKQTQPALAPGNKFVIPKRDGIPLTPFFDEREDAGWREVIDRLLAMSAKSEDDPYRDSVFFRPIGLRIGDEMHVARRVPLEPGARAALLLRFYNPHLAQHEIDSHELRVLTSEEALKVTAPARFPGSGDIEIELEAIGGSPELTVQIGPAPAQHASITERFATRNTDVTSPAANDGGAVQREELFHLYDVVFRHATFAPGDDLDTVEAFERLLPGDPRISEHKAMLLVERGELDRAYEILSALDRETMSDAARFCLFRLLLWRDSGTNLIQQILSLDLTAESRFEQLLIELVTLDARTLGRLVPPLVEGLPTDQLRVVLDRAGGRLESPDALAETAHNLYVVTGDADWAYQYLHERYRELRLNDSAVVEMLMELAVASGRTKVDAELGGDAERRMVNLIERGQLSEARALLGKTGAGLGRRTRDRLYHRIADHLAHRRHHVQAGEVMVELAYAACETGDLEAATDAVERARGLLVGSNGDASSEFLRDAARRVAAAWKDCRELVEWRTSAEERRRELLRGKLLNRQILVAGGFKQPEWEEPLRNLTGAQFDWVEKYRDEGDSLDSYVDRIRARRYAAVVYRLQQSGHEVSNKLKPECERAGVPFLPTPSSGMRGVVEALENLP